MADYTRQKIDMSVFGKFAQLQVNGPWKVSANR
jgi:hypothetical protein